MPVCNRCGAGVPKIKFAKNTNRNGSPRSNLCKLCVAEQAKLSLRESRSFPRLLAELPAWPDAKIESELAWLEKKMFAILDEQERRARRK
jgi:hypothetical protein